MKRCRTGARFGAMVAGAIFSLCACRAERSQEKIGTREEKGLGNAMGGGSGKRDGAAGGKAGNWSTSCPPLSPSARADRRAFGASASVQSKNAERTAGGAARATWQDVDFVLDANDNESRTWFRWLRTQALFGREDCPDVYTIQEPSRIAETERRECFRVAASKGNHTPAGEALSKIAERLGSSPIGVVAFDGVIDDDAAPSQSKVDAFVDMVEQFAKGGANGVFLVSSVGCFLQMIVLSAARTVPEARELARQLVVEMRTAPCPGRALAKTSDAIAVELWPGAYPELRADCDPGARMAGCDVTEDLKQQHGQWRVDVVPVAREPVQLADVVQSTSSTRGEPGADELVLETNIPAYLSMRGSGCVAERGNAQGGARSTDSGGAGGCSPTMQTLKAHERAASTVTLVASGARPLPVTFAEQCAKQGLCAKCTTAPCGPDGSGVSDAKLALTWGTDHLTVAWDRRDADFLEIGGTRIPWERALVSRLPALKLVRFPLHVPDCIGRMKNETSKLFGESGPLKIDVPSACDDAPELREVARGIARAERKAFKSTRATQGKAFDYRAGAYTFFALLERAVESRRRLTPSEGAVVSEVEYGFWCQD